MRVVLSCFTLAVLAALVTGVDRARACSCALPDARAALARSDGAFVGTLETRRESGQHAVLVFRVERVLKGSIGGFATVVTPANSAACGIELAEGTRVGLVLERMGGAWHGSLCAQFEPGELVAAAAPLPAPSGRGPAAIVVGGEFGPVRLLALDRLGRTLAYGRGGGRVLLVSVCPGERHLVEIASVLSGSVLLVRRLPTLKVVRRQTLRLPGNRVPVRLACQDQAGSSSVIFAQWPLGETPRRAALFRVRSGRVAAIWNGAGRDAALTPATAFVSAGVRGARLDRVDFITGRTRTVARLPGPTTNLVANESGRLVAGVVARLGQAVDVVRVELARADVASVRLPAEEGQAQVLWLDGGRLVFVPTYGSTARVLDGSLRTRSRFRWRAMSSVVAGSALYGTDLSLSLYRAVLPAGPQRVARRLPGRVNIIVSAS